LVDCLDASMAVKMAAWMASLQADELVVWKDATKEFVLEARMVARKVVQWDDSEAAKWAS